MEYTLDEHQFGSWRQQDLRDKFVQFLLQIQRGIFANLQGFGTLSGLTGNFRNFRILTLPFIMYV